MFMIHLVGDLHLPLHVSDNDDAGGNGRAIAAIGESDNLHGAWDSGIIRARHLQTEDLVAAAERSWLGRKSPLLAQAAMSSGRWRVFGSRRTSCIRNCMAAM